jgi:hypothetical protein
VSNALAFASVTAVLRHLLEPAADQAVTGAHATIERPDALRDDQPRVNLFLYQVTPNAAWRNSDLPTRRADGSVARRPQAAFDVHYILSFFGSERDHEPQRILGSVVSLLHSQPALSPEIIREAVQSITNGNPTHFLNRSDLARQIERVRFSPLGLNLEELSKLWSVFFQVPYRLSMAWQGSVVLVEPEVETRPSLPVRQRNLYVLPLQEPVIATATAAAGDDEPLLLGGTLLLRGRHLRGSQDTSTRVRIGGHEIEPPPEDVHAAEIRIVLAEPPFSEGTLRAGVLAAQVVHRVRMGTPPVPHNGFESNAAPFVLHPRIRTLPGDVPDVQVSAPDADGIRTVRVAVEPRVGARQQAVLLLHRLGGSAPSAIAVDAEPRDADSATVTFRVPGLAATEEHLLRVRIDGAESLLATGGDGRFARPRVVIP